MSAAAPALPPISVIDNTLGSLLIGSMIAAILYGITLCQTFRYYRLYPKDHIFVRILVPALFILETFHTFCTLDSCYFYMVTDYLNPTALLRFHPTAKLTIPITGVTTVLCQIFYARRVYLFGSLRLRYIALATVFITGKMAFCIAATVKVFGSPWVATVEQYSWLISASFGCTVVVDILLTGKLIYLLLRSRTGFKRTDDMVGVLVLYTLNTGLVTCVVGIIVFILAIAKPYNLTWASVSFISNKLYANAVLVVLNSRSSLNSRMFEGSELETVGAQLQWRTPTELSSPLPQITVPLPVMSGPVRIFAQSTADRRPGLNDGSRSRSAAGSWGDFRGDGRKRTPLAISTV